jgi:RimJ/RimL family protein N-acetyltransferase
VNDFKTNKKVNSSQILDFKNLFNKELFFDFDIILESAKVRLRPLDITDQEHLTQFALSQNIWTYFALKMSDLTSITNYIEDALEQRASRLRYTFIIEDPVTKTIMGSTAFGNFSKNDNRIEFGWSWIGKEFQGTGVNMHVKFLLSEFAFTILDLERIEAKTDVLNLRARKALIKIGMTEEGILRSHTLMPDGRRRDTIFYSILKDEWPSLQARNFQDFDFNISILNEKSR